MQNICKLHRNQRNKLQVAHFLEFAKNMSKHNANTMLSSADDGLMLSGYHKKLKTMKKKFFVLYRDTHNNTARLEYYDNERKFRSGLPPKRVIRLRSCFSINRRLDTKHEYVIALSTKDGGFGIVLDTEDEMLRWLEKLISLQRANFNLAEQQLRPQYEHVWQVYVQRKGLAECKSIIGNYHVCLTPKTITFVRIGSDKTSDGNLRMEHVEFQLTTIRRCGDSQCYFYMEVGRQSVIGPGELWMETEDALTAQNMHQMILSAMSAKVDVNNMGPMQRKRSSSANEASKPINVLQIKQTYVDNKYNNSPQTSALIFGRERCDSLPTRNRTSSESSNHSFTLPTGLLLGNNNARNSGIGSGLRPHSYQRHSNSPPISSAGFGCSESEESSISIDEPDDNGSFMPYRFNSRSSEGVIPEENTDEIGNSDSSTKYTDLSSQADVVALAENYVNMAPVIAKSQQAMSSSVEEVKFMQQQTANVNSPIHSSQHSALEFSECAVDHVAKISPDEEVINERPTRAYSIGSRNEHSRLFKQHMGGGFSSNIGGGGGGGGGGSGSNTNDTEHCNVRVRAFSVGSRAKIPRCDLQRGVLSPKMLYEQQQLLQQQLQQQQQHLRDKHCHSNNNISADAAQLSSSPSSSFAYNQLMQLYAQRDKKSTSAPLLLIHKSQNSVDRMSDLMEIDFSIKQSSNSTNSRINLVSSPITTATKTTTTATTQINTAALNKTYYSKSVLNSTSAATATTVATMPTPSPPPPPPLPLPLPITTATTTSIEATLATNTSNNSKNNSTTSSYNSNNSIRKYNLITTTNYAKQQQQQQQQQQQTISTTDNGYLEMKPVGSLPILTNITTSTTITTTTTMPNIKKQQKKHQQNNEQLQKPTPKTLLSTKTEPIGYDVPPEKSNNKQQHKQQQLSHLNINANITTDIPTAATTETISTISTTTTHTVLVNNKQHNQQLQEQQNIETINANTLNMMKQQQQQQLTADNDNHNILVEQILSNDDNKQRQQAANTMIISTTATIAADKQYNIINELDNKTETIKPDKQQECKLNKNIVSDDYANMERKFDAYMTLNSNPNSNNYTKTSQTSTTTISAVAIPATTTTTAVNLTKIALPKLHDNERHDEQQQKKSNHKNCSNNTILRNNANDAGYELLQIKSDKALNQRIATTNSNLNMSIVGNKKDNNNKLSGAAAIGTPRPNSTNSTLLYNSSSSNSTNCLNASLSQPVTPTTTTVTTTTTMSNFTTNSGHNAKITPPPTSRPSSVNLEVHELYYASLDWPQCSQEALIKTTMPKTADTIGVGVICAGSVVGVVPNETVILTSTPSVHNVYAKIDFDHSDSSSSSSKNI